MAAKTDNQQAHALITYFIARFKVVHKRDPLVNRYRDQYGFLAMLADLGYERSKEVIDYYLSLTRVDHPLIPLFRSYDRLTKIMQEQAEDAAERKRLMQETKERVEEWRQRGDGTGSP